MSSIIEYTIISIENTIMLIIVLVDTCLIVYFIIDCYKFFSQANDITLTLAPHLVDTYLSRVGTIQLALVMIRLFMV